MASRSLHTRSRAWQGPSGPDKSTTCTPCDGWYFDTWYHDLFWNSYRVLKARPSNPQTHGPYADSVEAHYALAKLLPGKDQMNYEINDLVLKQNWGIQDARMEVASRNIKYALGNPNVKIRFSKIRHEPRENPGRRRERRDQCHALSNKKMDKKVYKERRLIIDQIYRINDLISKAGLPPPPFVGVRVCEKHSRIAGVARLSKNFIWITEDSLKLPPNKLREVVLHELAHAVLGSEHDENCPLMGAILGDTDIPELERAFLDLYAEKVATGWVPESKPRRRRRNPPSSRSLHTRSRAWQGPSGPAKQPDKYLDEAIESFEDFLDKIYKQQYEYETEGDGLYEYDFLLADGGWDLKDYYNRGKIDHQYNHDKLIDLIIRYVENGPYSYEDLEELIIDSGEGSFYDLKWHEGIFGNYLFTIYSSSGGELEIPLDQFSGTVIDPSTGEEIDVDDVMRFYAKNLSQKELEKVNPYLHVSDFRASDPVGHLNLDGHYAWVAKPDEIEEELGERLERLNDKQLEEALKNPNLDPDLKQLIIDELDERKP